MVRPGVRRQVGADAQQRKKLNALDRDTAGQLDKILTDDQKKRAVPTSLGLAPLPTSPADRAGQHADALK